MRKFLFIIAGMLLSLNMISCKKENEEDLINKQGGQPGCDTTNIKYSVNVLPIIQNNCYSCHGNGEAEGGVNLDGYSKLRIHVDNNHLVNTITHAPGYPPMPQGSPQLSACDINIIKAWINNGSLDN